MYTERATSASRVCVAVQAWTAVGIFSEGYVQTNMYQLPLFHGPPKPYLLRDLAKKSTRTWLVDNVVAGQVRVLRHYHHGL